jgi:hypothetical protein
VPYSAATCKTYCLADVCAADAIDFVLGQALGFTWIVLALRCPIV